MATVRFLGKNGTICKEKIKLFGKKLEIGLTRACEIQYSNNSKKLETLPVTFPKM
jgi:hypothetical protein